MSVELSRGNRLLELEQRLGRFITNRPKNLSNYLVGELVEIRHALLELANEIMTQEQIELNSAKQFNHDGRLIMVGDVYDCCGNPGLIRAQLMNSDYWRVTLLDGRDFVYRSEEMNCISATKFCDVEDFWNPNSVEPGAAIPYDPEKHE